MLLRHEFTQFRREAAPQWLLSEPNDRPGGRDGHSNFAKAEDISGTANEEKTKVMHEQKGRNPCKMED